MSKASQSELEALHDVLAKALSESIKRKRTDEAGNVLDAPASILSVARQFLKDNGIEAQVTPENPLGKLAEDFPFQSDDATLQ